jgi:hypothetical protein
MSTPRFSKNKTALSLGVMIFWGVYFLLSPFFHYHPSDVHAHAGELNPHQHEGHFHSEELEALAHAWDFHPADDEQDKHHHHPHSSPEHDSDHIEFSLKNTSLKQADPAKVIKHKDSSSIPSPLRPPAFRIKEFQGLNILSTVGPRPFQERSPPSRFA